ncbi:MAG: cation-translocating P-type ATPase, partial [Lachnospiraceae bacterium]
MKFYLESVEEAFQEVKSSLQGLTQQEAQKRLEENGKNKLDEGEKISLFRRFLSQLADPMIIILIAAAAISGLTAAYANESFADVFIILFVVIINAVLGVYQENKAEKAIEALNEMAAATSKVLRDGDMVTVKSEELVVGDVIILEAGDAVPADARILESASLKIEEAALTGESVPVDKIIGILNLKGEKDVPLGDRKNMIYMGSTVVYGRGRAVITATGMNTEMGKIANALAQAEDNTTPLQLKLNQLSKTLSKIVIGICIFIFLFGLIKSGDFSTAMIIDTFMVAVSLAVAAIPEGLAAVVTIVLSIGVTNMSRRNAVIRKLTAVETLGCAQVICSDKTGTLTQNKMTVVDHYGDNENFLATAMALCSDADIDHAGETVGEPTECALVNYAEALSLHKKDLKVEMPRVGEAPFDSMRKMMSTVHQKANGEVVQFTKGAPDEVLKLCTHYLSGGDVKPMTDQAKEEILKDNKRMADKALRV